MRLFDPKFRNNKARYIVQCTLATLVIFVVLLVLDALTDAAIVGALGASSFISFTMPHAKACRPRYLIGGYAVGILAGVTCYYASLGASCLGAPFLSDSSHVVFGALSVGLAIFGMVLTDLEHPPAASVALGLVLNGADGLSILVVVLGVCFLAGAKTVLKPILIDLL